MLPIELCEKVFHSKEDGQKYSKKEIAEIRDFLYQLANIEYSEFKLKANGNQRSIIYQSFDR